MSSSSATGTGHCLTSHPRPTDVQGWRDGLPESLADSRTAELLEHVCDVDLDALDVELPRGLRQSARTPPRRDRSRAGPGGPIIRRRVRLRARALRGWNLVDLTEWSEPFCCSSSS